MKTLISLLLLSLFLISCGDEEKPDTGNGDGALGYTHNQLAEKFVKELNYDEDFEVTLAKNSTFQRNYIIIYDPEFDSYDAINIGDYDPQIHNAADYYFDSVDSNYFNLDMRPGEYKKEYYTTTEYEYDYYTGEYLGTYEVLHSYDVWVPEKYYDRGADLIFEKTTATPKDLAKIAAIKEVVAMERQAKFLSSQFGLSLERSQEVARLTTHWKKASLKGMTANEQDHFATELLGFSISQGKQAVSEAIVGNGKSLSDLVSKAANTNGITPEHAQKLMTKIFSL